jgi:hypothetical protein
MARLFQLGLFFAHRPCRFAAMLWVTGLVMLRSL